MGETLNDGQSTATKRRRFRFFGSKPRKDTSKTSSSKGAVAKRTTPSKATAAAAATATSPIPNTIPNHSAHSKGILKKDQVAAHAQPTPPAASTDKSPKQHTSSLPIEKAGWLARTKRFHKICDNAFELVDTDGSNSVDEKELYSGLLLIHLKLGTYAGPAACRPLGRERCGAIFQKFDADGSGELNRQEFHKIMGVLFGNVLLRVLAQWSLTLMIVPLVSQRLLDGIYWLASTSFAFILDLDEYTTLDEAAMLTLEEGSAWTVRHMPDTMSGFLMNAQDSIMNSTLYVPEPVMQLYDKLVEVLDKIPESVWNTVPLTLLSTILGILVVPYIIFKIDDLFQYLADREKSKARKDSKEKIAT